MVVACLFPDFIGRNKSFSTMKRPKNPTGTTERKRGRPSPRTRHRKEDKDFERTIPARRTPESEKQHDRVVNEDEQLKVVNQREDNAQASTQASNETNPANEKSRADGSNENEHPEAADDNNEVHPRPPKAN
jgi:cell division protein FtsN